MRFKTGRPGAKPNLTKLVKLNLPGDYPWKVLGWLRSDLVEFLTDDENNLLKQIIRDRDFAALTLLSEMWGLQSISIDPASWYTHISKMRAKYQLSALLKKFRFDTEKDERTANATKKFLAAEAVCQTFNQSGYIGLCFGETEHDARVFSYARAYIEKVIGGANVPSNDIVTKWSRHGPGSNLDTLKGQSGAYEKYANWPYSCTSSALPYARYLIQSDKRWLGFLENSYRSKLGIAKHLVLDQDVFWASVLKVVEGNCIAFVPKDALTERSVALEPAINLMLQLGVDGHIRQRLKRWGIDLDSQSKNQVLAFRGSIDSSDDSYVTLDMSAASDSISLKLCECLLPADWYLYLCKLRSPSGELGDEIIQYEKISSMGNGYTFALESLIFASLVYGVVRSMEGSFDPEVDYCVYGDDIIVRKKHANKVVRALTLAGFSLNTDKSFVEGPVRESCGTDWILGKPVRPVFFSEAPTDVLDLFVDINRMKRILKLRWGLEDPLTLRKMRAWIPEQFRGYLGPLSNEDFGSCLHTEMPQGRSRLGEWKYKRLIAKPISKNMPGFLNRKLMHDLRGANSDPLIDCYRKASKITSGGSRFTVVKRHAFTVGRSFSVASSWQSDYAESPTEVKPVARSLGGLFVYSKRRHGPGH